MGPPTSYLASLLICVFAINEIRPPTVTCQDDEGQKCLPRKTFIALQRLPEVSSNLAAYSRTARIIEAAKSRNEIVSLKTGGGSDDGEDTEICLPTGVYLELFSDPVMRGHLSASDRFHRMLEEPRVREREDLTFDGLAELEAEKRSIATLAKNGDLPITIRDREEDDGDGDDDEKRSDAESLRRDEIRALVGELLDERKRNVAALARDYALPPYGKRNIAALARDFALPNSGKRNIAALARDYALPQSGARNVAVLARDFRLPYYGKRNVGALARDFMLPSSSSSSSPSSSNGKRNVPALARLYLLPGSGKRNVAALARDYALPSGKRYLGALARSGGMPYRGYEEKRNVASPVGNGEVPRFYKRNVGALARDWSLPNQNRYGRSLDDRSSSRLGFDVGEELSNLQQQHVARSIDDTGKEERDKADAREKATAAAAGNGNGKKEMPKKAVDQRRPKRQIDYSDEYPLPVMQNTNVLDYEEMIEALTGEGYPNAEKRFMGAAGTAMDVQDDVTAPGYLGLPQPSKRHIGALARLGWLPSFRTARFSRSPRYPVDREDPADGTASDDPSNSSPWSLGAKGGRGVRYLKSSPGDCRHGFRRFLVLPSANDFPQ